MFSIRIETNKRSSRHLHAWIGTRQQYYCIRSGYISHSDYWYLQPVHSLQRRKFDRYTKRRSTMAVPCRCLSSLLPGSPKQVVF
jgi:hypothetical protein